MINTYKTSSTELPKDKGKKQSMIGHTSATRGNKEPCKPANHKPLLQNHNVNLTLSPDHDSRVMFEQVNHSKSYLVVISRVQRLPVKSRWHCALTRSIRRCQLSPSDGKVDAIRFAQFLDKLTETVHLLSDGVVPSLDMDIGFGHRMVVRLGPSLSFRIMLRARISCGIRIILGFELISGLGVVFGLDVPDGLGLESNAR